VLKQPVSRQRCATCQRWSGPRQADTDRQHVLIEAETDTGLCRGGPWDNSERRARSACGRWLCWEELNAPAA
jgi:hypothetical protein